MYENWIWVGETDPPATTEGEHWIGPRNLQNCELSEAVNSGTELMPGAACTSELSFVLWNAPEITSGTRLVYFQKQGESLVRIGTFTADKPTKQTKSTNKVLAYDAMAKTEKDLSDWLRSIQDKFPIPLLDFARQVCEQCGLELVNESIPNGDYQIQQFYSDGITARQLLIWVGQACGRFCRATPEGKLEFAWYKESPKPIGGGTSVMAKVRLAGNTLRVADRDTAAPPEWQEIYRIAIDSQWYYADGLSYEDYATAVIDKVQINQSESDVGVIVPPDAAGTNALVLSGNLLLLTEDDASLRPVAETLYEQFKDIAYTPFKVTLPADSGFRAGDIVLVTDANGKGFQSYVMSAKISGGRVTLESTGSAARTASTAVNSSVQKNLRGKMLEIQSTVDGLKITASELSGQYTELEQTVEGLTLTAENGGDKSVLSLKAGETTLSSAEIVFAGTARFVTHDQLSTAGETEINGGNIKTGIVQNYDGTTIYDLEKGTIQMGSDAGPHVKITNNMIRWYLGTNIYSNGAPTGVFYSVLGASYIGANSEYVYYGWMPEGTPSGSNYYGFYIQNQGNAHFTTNKVECGGEHNGGNGQLEANTVKCNNLNVTTGKGRIVDTPDYGVVTMEAMESPMPIFCDNGSGVLNENGQCLLTLHPVFLETVAVNVTPQWHVTASAPVTVRKEGLTALVEGEPGTAFDWLCILPQKGREGTYAPCTDISREDYAGANDYIAQMELKAIQNQITILDRQVLTVAQENDLIETVFPEEVSA